MRSAPLRTTQEAAQQQRGLDKAEPQWRRRGRFHVLATPTLIAYLSFMTGIDKKNIEARKTEAGWLHVAWANRKGMHKEKLYIGTFYQLTEENLAPLIGKMVGAPLVVEKS